MRMYHTAAENLDPAAALAEPAACAVALEAGDIHVRAGFGEREMMRAELGFRIRPEQLAGKFSQSSLKVREGDILINNQSLYLVERRRMRCVHFVGTEYTSRRNHTDRQLSLFHHTRLHR